MVWYGKVWYGRYTSCLRSGFCGRRSDGIHIVGQGRGCVDVGICAGCWLECAIDRGERGKLAMSVRGIGTIIRVRRFCG